MFLVARTRPTANLHSKGGTNGGRLRQPASINQLARREDHHSTFLGVNRLGPYVEGIAWLPLATRLPHHRTASGSQQEGQYREGYWLAATPSPERPVAGSQSDRMIYAIAETRFAREPITIAIPPQPPPVMDIGRNEDLVRSPSYDPCDGSNGRGNLLAFRCFFCRKPYAPPINDPRGIHDPEGGVSCKGGLGNLINASRFVYQGFRLFSHCQKAKQSECGQKKSREMMGKRRGNANRITT